MRIQMVLPALKAVERNVGAWIREVRATSCSPGPLRATTAERRERARGAPHAHAA